FFGCGYVANYSQRSVSKFLVTRTDDIANIIIPFSLYTLFVGSKYYNYLDFKSAYYY
ncbi:uncharacterized protein EURHEDRAFT_468435, partial [Aspergillus ruber CBS 135680]